MPPASPRRPANNAAKSASKYVSRARFTSSGSRRLVHATALLEVRKAVRRRPDQGMAEGHAHADPQEISGLGGRRGRRRDTEQAGGAPQEHGVADGLGRCDEEELLGLVRKRPQTP